MVQCGICGDPYDRDSKKPLVVPCGDVFCLNCLEDLGSSNVNDCPICEKSWGNMDISTLTVCRQVLPTSYQEDQNKTNFRMLDWCDVHGFKNDCWCLTCKKTLCLTCVSEEHKKCDWSSLKEAVNNEAATLPETTRIKTIIDATIDKVDEAINSNKSKCTALRLFKVQIEKLVEKTKHFLGTLQSSKSELVDRKKKLSEINSDNFTASKLQELAETNDLIKEYEPLQVILEILIFPTLSY